MMLAIPQKSAINEKAMVVPEGLDRVKRFKSLVCLTTPFSATEMRGVPSQVSNLARDDDVPSVDMIGAADRLWARVDRGAVCCCWDWRGAVNTWGYGVIRVGKKRMMTHRLALTLSIGEAPPGKPLALHSCDRPSCCNPAHLRWGDNQDNRNDRVRDPFARNTQAQESAQ